jgi:RNA polymerase sigma-70 factor (ECF subfamily)
MEAEPAPLALPMQPQVCPLAVDAGVRVERMVRQHFDAVWRSLRRLGVADGAVDDAAQQVFLVAARRLDIIEPAGEKSYLLGIAVRVAADARRTRTRRREVADDELCEPVDPQPSPEDLVERKRARALLDRVLMAMPMDLRAAFTMFEIEGMSVPEVADALGVAQGTAASRLRRARELFHQHVRRLGLTKGGSRV